MRWFSRQPSRVLLTLALTIALAVGPASAQTPSIEGTYRLVSRTLKDGTALKPREVIVLQTTKEYRQFNIVSKDPEGRIVSCSIIATYTLTSTEYTETTLLHLPVRGNEVRNLSDQPQRAAVTVEGRRITIDPKQSEPRVTVFEDNRFTTSSQRASIRGKRYNKQYARPCSVIAQ
jgi:hypothetical protein